MTAGVVRRWTRARAASTSRAGQGRPGRVHPDGRGEHEPGEGAGHHRDGEYRHPGRPGGRRGLGTGVQVGGEEPPEDGVLGSDGDQPRQRHQRGESGKTQPAGRERQQVGQVGDGQQQGRSVRKVGAGIHMRPGTCPQPGGGGEHHRGEQHHRRVQAQHRRDHRGARRRPQPEAAAAAPLPCGPSTPRRCGTAPRRRTTGRAPAPQPGIRSPAPATPPQRGRGPARSLRYPPPQRRRGPPQQPPASPTGAPAHRPAPPRARRRTGLPRAACSEPGPPQRRRARRFIEPGRSLNTLDCRREQTDPDMRGPLTSRRGEPIRPGGSVSVPRFARIR